MLIIQRPEVEVGEADDNIQSFVISYDQMNDPDVLSINGAGAALALAPLPFLGPIGAVRVGRVNGQFIAMPDNAELAESEMNMVVAGTAEAVTMVEAGMNEVSEDIAIEAIAFAHAEIKKICAAVEELRRNVGWKAVTYTPPEEPKAAIDAAAKGWLEPMRKALHIPEKLARTAAKRKVFAEIREALVQTEDASP